MQTIYEAPNSAEAYMILNLLQQAGLSGRVDGEYLQGGAGGIQAIGLVRVLIDESDYEEANVIIQQWDAMRPLVGDTDTTAAPKSSHIGTGIFGFLSGIMVAALFYNTPISRDGFDLNGDGKIDEEWTYVDGYISKLEWDRNFDGALDYVSKFDRIGTVKSATSDEDFNGTFESTSRFEYNNIVDFVSDTDGDGFKDMLQKYKFGVLESIIFLNPDTKKPAKVIHYTSYKPTYAEADTTNDGILDSKYEYNDIGDVIDVSRSQPD